MTSATPSINVEALRQRKASGTSIKALASEVGMSWQKLWVLLTPTSRLQSSKPSKATRSSESRVRPAVLQVKVGASQLLVDKYRPRSLDGVWGQERAVSILRKFLSAPTSTPFLFEGETGTGKTSTALALAAELGCDMEQGEFGGIYQIASGEQTAETVRSVTQALHNIPFYGSGWKVLVVNEADRMHIAAETVWLDRLEHLPSKTVVVFTTNYAERLPARLSDRCRRVKFEAQAGSLQEVAVAYASAIWKSETGQDADPEQIAAIVKKAAWCDELSFRRVVQVIADTLAGNELDLKE